jgi:hypothetical protein
MKKYILLIVTLLSLITKVAFSQEIIFTAKEYYGGFNTSCNNVHDGEIRATVVWEAPPFTYQWSTGAFSNTIANVGAGSYILTVVNSLGASVTDTIVLTEPEPLDAFVYLSDFAGSNISGFGRSDGEIVLEPFGGAPDYAFLWSNGSQESRISELSVGTYSVTITDRNACTKSISRTLTEPQVLQITGVAKSNFNGFNVSCKEGRDGWADVTVVGGKTPYSYRWSSGGLTKKAEELAAGNYQVEITDANNVKVMANITLTQPNLLDAGLAVPIGVNGFNISCFQCANGSASVTPNGGVTPYSYLWSTGSTATSLTNLNRSEYNVKITDANGCEVIEEFQITEPGREDWAMTGNSNINSNTNYLGTNDSNSFVFRTNALERLKIGSNGEITFSKYASTSNQILMIDAQGKISPVPLPSLPCTGPIAFPWQQSPNDPADVFSCWRRFGIGTDDPQTRLEVKGGLSRFTSAYSSSSYIELGHDGGTGGGGNAILNNVGDGDLLINYNIPKNVVVCDGNSGSFVVGGTTLLAKNSGNVGIGIANPQFKLDIAGTLNASNVFVNGTSILGGIWNSSGPNIYYNSGNVGIGNSNPLTPLHLNEGSSSLFFGPANNDNGQLGYGTSYIGFNARRIVSSNPNANVFITNSDGIHNGGGLIWNDISGAINLATIPTDNSNVNGKIVFEQSIGNYVRMKISPYGSLALGTENEINEDIQLNLKTNKYVGINVGSDYILGNGPYLYCASVKSSDDKAFAVINTTITSINYPNGEDVFRVLGDGRVEAKKLKISQSIWSDFVFDSTYNLMPIGELAQFISDNKHLPDVPTQAEVYSNGIDQGETNAMLLKKIEELTLYIILLKNEIDTLSNP